MRVVHMNNEVGHPMRSPVRPYNKRGKAKRGSRS